MRASTTTGSLASATYPAGIWTRPVTSTAGVAAIWSPVAPPRSSRASRASGTTVPADESRPCTRSPRGSRRSMRYGWVGLNVVSVRVNVPSSATVTLLPTGDGQLSSSHACTSGRWLVE